MKLLKTLFIMLFGAALFLACSKQDGRVTGVVVPPGAGLLVIATQSGSVIKSVPVGGQDGAFSLNLQPGSYDISVSSPDAPFPVVFPATTVVAGKTTDLQRIDLPAESGGESTLTGRLSPRATTVRLFEAGQERAMAVVTDEGEYTFKEIPAGSYTVQASAPGYAGDSIPVNVPREGAVNQDISLLYISPIDGIDWAEGKLRVTGTGMPPAHAPNKTISRAMAERAALTDARRKLVKAISEIKTGPDRRLKTQLGEKTFSQKIEGFIRGYTVAGKREFNDGKIEIDLELSLTGPNGLARSLGR